MNSYGSKSDQKKKTGRSKRIEHELKDLNNDKLSNIKVDIVEDDLTHLKGHFNGPPDTPYEGGKFTIDIKIPSDYPFRPPTMKFETKIWHPNVSSVTVREKLRLNLLMC
jgi:ubiquitin-conjugating enzyme (huntingtin interacting protein 2)